MSSTPSLCILLAKPGISAFSEGVPVFGWDREFLKGKILRAGIPESQVHIETISKTSAAPTEEDFAACLSRLNAMPSLRVLVPLDEAPLRFVTGKKSITKWHLSPLDSLPEFVCRAAVPSFSPDAVKKDFALGLYVEMALARARKCLDDGGFIRKEYRFRINPPLAETLELLKELETKEWLSVDFETGRGQINTVGFAWSASDAIAIKTLDGDYSQEEFLQLWQAIGRVLEGSPKKIPHNAIFEVMCASAYGIHIQNITHDTQVAQKFLYPELKKGLHNVARIYTNEPYWKDDGKVLSEEGDKKDWSNIRDWDRHFTYNCKDTTGTFEAAFSQLEDLRNRAQLGLFYDYIQRLIYPLSEMCIRGLPLDSIKQAELLEEYEDKVASLRANLSQPINPGSSKDKIALLKGKGYKIPRVLRSTGKTSESADELSLKKLRLKHPDDTDLKALIAVSHTQKALSSYIKVKTLGRGTVHFMLDAHGTETGRFSSTKDPWSCGFNAQTIPEYAKAILSWPKGSERTFLQIDLRQAESRYVAYASADPDLIRMLETPGEDIHRYVAAEIFGIAQSQVTPEQRQLGKKSGHGANYSMGEVTFQESCLKEMDLVLSRTEAAKTLAAYHKLFPGIRRWHASIKKELWAKRKLSNPFGRTRYFYGRLDDNTFREAYAYCPQSTIPDVVNALMLRLWQERVLGKLDFWLHLQCHDSLTLSCNCIEDARKIAEFAHDLDLWHPEIVLPAGRLRIPVSIEVGTCLGELENLTL